MSDENATKVDETTNTTDPNTNNTTQGEDFSVGADTVSKTIVRFTGGFTKGFLVGVKAQEIGKESKYFVLDFNFRDAEGIKSFTHREFIPKGQANTKESETENYATRKNRFNSRIKHIWEAFAPFPAEGLGKGATSWNDVFIKIAAAFTTGTNGNPIYQTLNGDKKTAILVWLKCTYSNKNEIQFPMMPNFIEKLTPDNQAAPKTLQINKNFDKTTQEDTSPSAQPNMMGGATPGIHTGGGTDMGF